MNVYGIRAFNDSQTVMSLEILLLGDNFVFYFNC